MDKEMIEAVKAELQLFRFAEQKFPGMLVKDVRSCACMGPLPECKCMKRERLVKEFIGG